LTELTISHRSHFRRISERSRSRQLHLPSILLRQLHDCLRYRSSTAPNSSIPPRLPLLSPFLDLFLPSVHTPSRYPLHLLCRLVNSSTTRTLRRDSHRPTLDCDSIPTMVRFQSNRLLLSLPRFTPRSRFKLCSRSKRTTRILDQG